MIGRSRPSTPCVRSAGAPRGTSPGDTATPRAPGAAGLFAGGTIGDDVGGAFGSVAGGIGSFVGMLGGMKAADAASGLPPRMLVGASATTVYGFASHSRSQEPSELVSRVPRDQLDVEVHTRVDVRVLELIDAATGRASSSRAVGCL